MSNFHQLEVVGRATETQLQVVDHFRANLSQIFAHLNMLKLCLATVAHNFK